MNFCSRKPVCLLPLSSKFRDEAATVSKLIMMSLHWGLYQPAVVLTIEKLKLCLDSDRISSTILTKYGSDDFWFNSPLSLTSGFPAGQNWEILLSKAAVHTWFTWRHVADKAGFVHSIFSNRKPQHSSTDLSKREDNSGIPCALHWSQVYFWQQLCVLTASPLLWEDKFYFWMLNEEIHSIFTQPVGPGQGAAALLQGRYSLRNALLKFKHAELQQW